MTALEERLRLVGRELDRAVDAYAAGPRGEVYVKSAPPPAHRPLVVVAIGAVVAACVVLLLSSRRADQESSTVTEPPDGPAISATLGDAWIWPRADSGVVTGSAEQVAREFSVRVLHLPDAVINSDASDGGAHPTWLRIETSTLTLSLLVAPQGSADRWVIHQIGVAAGMQVSQSLVVPSPVNAASAELYVRFVHGTRSFQLPVDPSGGFVNLPVDDLVSTTIAVFRDSNGAVIDVVGGEFGNLGAPDSFSCEISLNAGRAITPLFAAAVGGSATIAIQPYAINFAVLSAESGALTLRVDVTGSEGVVFRDEHPIDVGLEQTITGSAQLPGEFSYTCTQRIVRAPASATPDGVPKFVRTATPR